MKNFSTRILNIAIFLLMVTPIGAQDVQTPDNTDSLKMKIERLEKEVAQTGNPKVRSLYKRSLLELYGQYITALKKDVAALQNLQGLTSGTKAQSDDIAAALKESDTQLKEATERMSKWTNGNASPTPPPAASENSTSDSRPRTASTPPASGNTPPADNGNSVAKKDGDKTADGGKEKDTVTVKLCGQIRPASLNKTFAFIKSSGDSFRNTQQLATLKAVHHSRYDDRCANNTNYANSTDEPDYYGYVEDVRKFSLSPPPLPSPTPLPPLTVQPYNGSQKAAVVLVLQSLVLQLQQSRSANGQARSAERVATKRNGLIVNAPTIETVKKQILLLEEYVGNAAVYIKSKDDEGKETLEATLFTDKDGNYFSDTLKLIPNKIYYVSTEADGDANKERELTVQAGTNQTIRIDLPIEDRPVSLLSRAVVGMEQAGAASRRKDINFFFDLFVSKTLPFKQSIDPDYGEKYRTWIDFRFGSVPQSGAVTLAEVAGGTGLATSISGLKLKEVLHIIDVTAGVEVRLTGNNALLPSFDRRTRQKFSLSFIAGGGFTTPLDATSPDSRTVFKVFKDAPGLPKEAIGKEFIAFVPSDRDRFFRQYFVGLRFQTFFFNLYNLPSQRFPAQLDLTLGQNEFITGGRFRGAVFRIDGYFPLPYEKLKFINVIGTASLRPGRGNIGTPLILEPATTNPTIPAANVAIIAIPQPNRDYYRVGFGIDFISFAQQFKKLNPSSKNSSAKDSSLAKGKSTDKEQ